MNKLAGQVGDKLDSDERASEVAVQSCTTVKYRTKWDQHVSLVYNQAFRGETQVGFAGSSG